MVRNTTLRTMGGALFGIALAAGYAPCVSALGATSRLSLSSAGQESNGTSRQEETSADGRFAVFVSDASNLVAGDNNGTNDVFLRDRLTGKTTRISISASGEEGNGMSFVPRISANGRYVYFGSDASNLVLNDTNGTTDAFLYDRVTGKLERILTSAGQQLNGGAYPAASAISADGRYITLATSADNLVPGDTNKATDIFIRDRATGKTERVSVATDGTQADLGTWYHGRISDNGRYVAFYSDSTNLVPGDTNDLMDLFVRDRLKKTTTRISVGPNGEQGDGWSYFPRLSSNGRFLVFASAATTLVPGDTNRHTDVFLHDQLTHKTTRISLGPNGEQGDGDSDYPSISADGRFITFDSTATNLVAGDTNGAQDVFIYDRLAKKTTRLSIDTQGGEGNGGSSVANLSSDGRHVVYSSTATNLVANDTNNRSDIFLSDRLLIADQSADVSVTQTDSRDPIRKGETVIYTLTIHNAGPDAAPGVTLTDILPATAGLVSVSPSQGACSSGKTMICRLGKLAMGQNATVSLTVRAGTIIGKLFNQVHVNAFPKDPKPLNNTSTAVTTVAN